MIRDFYAKSRSHKIKELLGQWLLLQNFFLFVVTSTELFREKKAENLLSLEWKNENIDHSIKEIDTDLKFVHSTEIHWLRFSEK